VTRTRSGFTLVEVLVAVTIMTVGVVAMAGSTATVTRMIGRGKIDTRAAQLATQQMEVLRRVAYSTSPRCTSANFANGALAANANITVTWTVAVAGTGRTLNVIATYATPRGPRSQTLTSYVEC
jgi:prepilin-type N-terminal cleavage/methylation domain-containing protein